jgi:RNA polymerase sigma factor (TIGR02999 family)
LQRQQTPTYLDLIGTTPNSHDGEGPRMQSEDAASSPGEITRLAAQWGAGDRDALQSLIELVYDELRELAHHSIRTSRPDTVLDTTVLVHEAYLRLARVEASAWPSRAHFFAFCSTAMRRILIDYARRHGAVKRGGSRVRVPLTAGMAVSDDDIAEVLAVEDALTRLEQRNSRMARIVECRFFGGMSADETAEALATSKRTVEREWARARAYLQQALADDDRPARAAPDNTPSTAGAADAD